MTDESPIGKRGSGNGREGGLPAREGYQRRQRTEGRAGGQDNLTDGTEQASRAEPTNRDQNCRWYVYDQPSRASRTEQNRAKTEQGQRTQRSRTPKRKPTRPPEPQNRDKNGVTDNGQNGTPQETKKEQRKRQRKRGGQPHEAGHFTPLLELFQIRFGEKTTSTGEWTVG